MPISQRLCTLTSGRAPPTGTTPRGRCWPISDRSGRTRGQCSERSATAHRLASLFAGEKKLGVDVEQGRQRQADDVLIVALHLSHQRRAGPLDRVAAGPSTPLAAGKRPVEQRLVELAEG